MPTKKRLVALELDVYVVQREGEPSEEVFKNRIVVLDSGERLLFVPWMETPNADLEAKMLEEVVLITEYEREREPTPSPKPPDDGDDTDGNPDPAPQPNPKPA